MLFFFTRRAFFVSINTISLIILQILRLLRCAINFPIDAFYCYCSNTCGRGHTCPFHFSRLCFSRWSCAGQPQPASRLIIKITHSLSLLGGVFYPSSQISFIINVLEFLVPGLSQVWKVDKQNYRRQLVNNRFAKYPRYKTCEFSLCWLADWTTGLVITNMWTRRRGRRVGAPPHLASDLNVAQNKLTKEFLLQLLWGILM